MADKDDDKTSEKGGRGLGLNPFGRAKAATAPADGQTSNEAGNKASTEASNEASNEASDQASETNRDTDNRRATPGTASHLGGASADGGPVVLRSDNLDQYGREARQVYNQYQIVMRHIDDLTRYADGLCVIESFHGGGDTVKPSVVAKKTAALVKAFKTARDTKEKFRRAGMADRMNQGRELGRLLATDGAFNVEAALAALQAGKSTQEVMSIALSDAPTDAEAAP